MRTQLVFDNRDLQLRDVIVHAGEVTEPTTLNNDLVGSTIEKVVVKLRKLDGTAPNQAFVVIDLPPEAHANYNARSASTDAHGDATFILPRSTVADVEVQSYGRITQKITAASLPLEVVMHAGLQLAVSIEGLGAVRNAASMSLCATKREERAPLSPILSLPNSLWPPSSSMAIQMGTACLNNLAAGDYRVWLVSHAKHPGAAAKFLALGDVTLAANGPQPMQLPQQLTA